MTNFVDRLIGQFALAVQGLPREVLDNCAAAELNDDAIRACAEEAATAAVAPIIWGKAIGNRLTTAEVIRILDISRQALNKKLAQRKLVGIPGQKTTYYPSWQFDAKHKRINPIVDQIMQIFKEADADDPFMIASWATTPDKQLLDGMTPAEWITKETNTQKLLEAARCAASPVTHDSAPKKSQTQTESTRPPVSA